MNTQCNLNNHGFPSQYHRVTVLLYNPFPYLFVFVPVAGEPLKTKTQSSLSDGSLDLSLTPFPVVTDY